MQKRGFTLIELLAVIAIIGILAAIITTSLGTSKAKSRDARRIADIKNIQVALELYYNDNGFYPPPPISSALVPSYLPIEPKDPSDNLTAYKYTLLSTVSSNCSADVTRRNKYHLGAAMENDESSNASLKQDHDYYSGTYSHFVCTGGGTDFHGNATTGSSPCVGSSAALLDQCYDVTN